METATSHGLGQRSSVGGATVRGCFACVTVAAAISAGCVLKNPPDAAALATEALSTVAVPPAWTAAGAGPGVVSDNWLTTFQDDQLTAAVIEAIAHNADLRVGAARVEQARLHAKLAGAKLYPSVDLLARGGGKMSGDNSGLQGAAITVGWELDLWGRVRYGRNAAAEDNASAQADYEFARQSIAAGVARAWFSAIQLTQQARLAGEMVASSQQLAGFAADRERVGAGENAAHTRHLRRLRCVDRDDFGMCPVGSNEITVKLPGEVEVRGVASLAGDQARIFAPIGGVVLLAHYLLRAVCFANSAKPSSRSAIRSAGSSSPMCKRSSGPLVHWVAVRMRCGLG